MNNTIDKRLLSICIPTFNRINKIKYTLEAVAKQISILKNSREVELLVSDNASTDGTQDYLNGICNKYSFLTINLNKYNLGWGGQVNFFKNTASGKYLIILSDDDFYAQDMVKSILDAIKKHTDADYFFIPMLAGKYDFKEDIKYSRKEFIELGKMAFAALPSNVFKTNMIKNYKINSITWPHCELIFNLGINNIYILSPMINGYYPPATDKTWWHNNPDRVIEYDTEIVELISKSKLLDSEKGILIGYYKKIMFGEVINYIVCNKFQTINNDKYISILSNNFNKEATILKLSNVLIVRLIIKVLFFIKKLIFKVLRYLKKIVMVLIK